MTHISLKHLDYQQKLSKQGIICSCVFLAATIALSLWSQCTIFNPLIYFVCSFTLVWAITLLKARYFLKEVQLLNSPDTTSDIQHKIDSVRHTQQVLKRWCTPIVELLFATILIVGSSLWLFGMNDQETTSIEDKILITLAFTGMLTFGVLLASLYFNKSLSGNSSHNIVKAGVGSFTYFSIVLCALVLVLCASFYKVSPVVLIRATVVLSVINILIGLETLIKMFFRLFKPRKRGELLRPAFESYLFDVLKSPRNIKRIFSDVINSQLGFDASETAFVSLAIALFLPLILFSIILMLALSSIVFVAPYENALLLRFGNATDRVLTPGVHLKAPWPIDEARVVDVWHIKRVHVGSHKQQGDSDSMYKSDRPILWTNLHGINMDEFLIVAPPSDLLETLETDKAHLNSDENRQSIPSISLIGADIFVEYRVRNVREYLKSCTKPDELFKCIAESEVSRSLYKYDVDSLFCEGRISLPTPLKESIQIAADNSGLGIVVLSVGIGSVHPPQDVAASFQETVSALQEKEMSRQTAERYALKTIIETAGTKMISDKLLASIDVSERGGKAATVDSPRLRTLLYSSGGFIAQLLSEARSYRWERDNTERSKSERFNKEILKYEAAPKTYLTNRYMSVLEKGLDQSPKFMLVGERDDLILRFDIKELSENYNYNDDDPYIIEDR